jgi:hypothetical protein
MSKEWKRIEFYKERSFGERLGAAFSFVRENWKPIGRYSLIVLSLPILLFSLFLALLIGQSFSFFARGYLTPSSFGILIGFFLFAILFAMTVPSLIIAFLQLYNEREERLKGIRLADVMKMLKGNFLRMTAVMVLLIIVCIFFAWMAVKVGQLFAWIVALLAFFTVGVPLLLLLPIYFIEKKGFFKAIGRSFSLGYKTWGSTFGIGIVLKLIDDFISSFFAFPWLILTYVEYTFFSESDTFTISAGYEVLIFFLTLLMIVGSVIAALPLHLGLCYQYAHAATHKDERLVVDDVDTAAQSFKIVREESAEPSTDE